MVRFITAPVAAIIITIIIVLSAFISILFITGSDKNYATIHHEEGFHTVGTIYSMGVHTEGKISDPEMGVLVDGTSDEVIDWIRRNTEEKDLSKVTWRDGVTAELKVGLKINGNVDVFFLTTHSVNIVSDGRVNPQRIIDRFEKAKSDATLEKNNNFNNAVRYGSAPGFIPQLVTFVQNLY